jgi:hypothetical protein
MTSLTPNWIKNINYKSTIITCRHYLDDLVEKLLGTKEVKLKSKAGIARKSGLPFDPKRLALFEKLHSALKQTLPTTKITKKMYEALPFF